METSESAKKIIGDVSEDVDQSSEEIPKAFTCCVCLELLYKPIILACGHVSCFWCVHQSMSSLCESQCPICRCGYHHFPTICQMLHFILAKMYPVEYKRREIEISEFEKEIDCFSPQIMAPLCKEQIKQELCGGSSQMQGADTVPSSFIAPDKNDGICQKISVKDALCITCNQLVYRPVTLTCGHVYCQSCVTQTNEKIKCVECQIAHRGQNPKVCLELDNFLEEKFPMEYATRKSSIQLKQPCVEEQGPSTCSDSGSGSGSSKSDLKNKFELLTSGNNKVHLSVGCDSCGMYPIVGDRYKCKDCVELVGFDLCGECYKTRSKLPGRFNQQHTPEHQFEIQISSVSDIMLRLLRNITPPGSGSVPQNFELDIPTLLGMETAENDIDMATSGDSDGDPPDHNQEED